MMLILQVELEKLQAPYEKLRHALIFKLMNVPVMPVRLLFLINNALILTLPLALSRQ